MVTLKDHTSWRYVTWRELLGEAPRLLEELLEVGLAVQHAVHGRVAAHLQAAKMHTGLHAASETLISSGSSDSAGR